MLAHDPSELDTLRVHARRQKGLAPVNTLEVGCASGVAQAVSEHLPQSTPQTAQKIYELLVEVGIKLEERRGHAPSVVESVFHLPLELVAEVAQISRTTVWRHLSTLRKLGVVDCRTHKASCRYGERIETRNSGSVWRVRLSPLQGSKARVSADDLRHKWRGKEMRGAASKRALEHTQKIQERLIKIEMLIDWAVKPASTSPVKHVCSKAETRSLEALLDVKYARPKEEGKAVDLAARALSSALADQKSLDWYRRLAWSLLRHYKATGEDQSPMVYLMAQRARTDTQEGFARKPGALFVSRLKAAPWWSSVMNSPPTRVRVQPASA